MKKIFFLLFVLLGFAGSVVYAQNNQITGIVSDTSGNAIVGASVVEKGVPSN